MLFGKRRKALAANARPGRRARVALRPSVEVLEGRALLATFIPFGGHYYAATDGPLTWQQAENQAVKLGGHLAAITSQAEQNFLTANFAVHEDIWIGLSGGISRGHFTWSTREQVTYLAFYPGEPNNGVGSEDFVHMNLGSGLWDDTVGNAQYRGIIELNRRPTVPSAPPRSPARMNPPSQPPGVSGPDRIELTFAQNAMPGGPIAYDPNKGIKDDAGNNFYVRVDVLVAGISGRKNNNNEQIQVKLYWATGPNESDIIDKRAGYETATRNKTITHADTHPGGVVSLYFGKVNFRGGKLEPPPEATYLVAIIDPQMKLKGEGDIRSNNVGAVPLASMVVPRTFVIFFAGRATTKAESSFNNVVSRIKANPVLSSVVVSDIVGWGVVRRFGGHLASTVASGPQELALATNEVKTFLAREGRKANEPILLVGHSSGGFIAYQLASKLPISGKKTSADGLIELDPIDYNLLDPDDFFRKHIVDQSGRPHSLPAGISGDKVLDYVQRNGLIDNSGAIPIPNLQGYPITGAVNFVVPNTTHTLIDDDLSLTGGSLGIYSGIEAYLTLISKIK